MSMYQQIKADQIQARKNKNAEVASILTVLLGEAGTVGKNAGNREPTDDEVTAVIKKFIKNINDTIALGVAATPTLEAEQAILHRYLPQQYSEDELRNVISSFVASTMSPNIGGVMKMLQTEHKGKYDAKAASQIIRDVLASQTTT